MFSDEHVSDARATATTDRTDAVRTRRADAIFGAPTADVNGWVSSKNGENKMTTTSKDKKNIAKQLVPWKSKSLSFLRHHHQILFTEASVALPTDFRHFIIAP